MSDKSTKICIVKNSMRIRKILKERFVALKKTHVDVIEDAKARGRSMTSSSLGRFIKNGNVKSTLSQEDVLWLCFRYGIEVQLIVGTPKTKEGKISLTIPEYDEEQCLKQLARIFPPEIKEDL